MRMTCNVSGKVTGVGYRAFVQKKARALWLHGYIKNLGQAGVELVAEGSELKLNQLLEHVRKGPFNAQVRNVEVLWGDASEEFDDFVVFY